MVSAGPTDQHMQQADNKPEFHTLQTNFLDMLPFASGCSSATGELDLALTAYNMAHGFLDPEDPEYCNVRPPLESLRLSL